MGFCDWKAWMSRSGKQVWSVAKKVELLAKVSSRSASRAYLPDEIHQRTSSAALTSHLRCEAFHQTNQSEQCYLCARRRGAAAPSSSESEPQVKPRAEQEQSVSFPTTQTAPQGPTFYINVQIGSGYQPENGQSPVIIYVTPILSAEPSPPDTPSETSPTDITSSSSIEGA
jgi:hypothetical protein